jgi:hypothetical protein
MDLKRDGYRSVGQGAAVYITDNGLVGDALRCLGKYGSRNSKHQKSQELFHRSNITHYRFISIMPHKNKPSAPFIFNYYLLFEKITCKNLDYAKIKG